VTQPPLCAFVFGMQTIQILEDLVEKGSENMDVRNKEEVVLSNVFEAPRRGAAPDPLHNA